MLVGVSALLRSLWLNRNDVVFNKTKQNTFWQILFRMTYWICTWSLLHKDEEAQDSLKHGCRLVGRLRQSPWRFLRHLGGDLLIELQLSLAFLLCLHFVVSETTSLCFAFVTKSKLSVGLWSF